MKLCNSDRTSTQGFTLIELMIVVAILGILSVVAVPNYQTYIARAKSVDAVIMIDTIQKAQAHSFVSDGYFITAVYYVRQDSVPKSFTLPRGTKMPIGGAAATVAIEGYVDPLYALVENNPASHFLYMMFAGKGLGGGNATVLAASKNDPYTGSTTAISVSAFTNESNDMCAFSYSPAAAGLDKVGLFYSSVGATAEFSNGQCMILFQYMTTDGETFNRSPIITINKDI